MFNSPPNISDWIFDPIIKRPPPLPVTINNTVINLSEKNNSQINLFNYIYNDISTLIFKNINKSLQLKIIKILNNQFGKIIDINDNTKIHLLFRENNLAAILSSELDENIGALLRNNGYKEVESLGIRSNGIYLYNLWVNPSYRNQGLAKKLLRYVETYYRNRRKQSIRAQISADNEISLKLFLNSGYLEEHRGITLDRLTITPQIKLSKWL